jgi:glycosyltransferase involved in cell wall biosynthesis
MNRELMVTVLIPCRDGESTLRATIKSLLNQTVKTFIVVADDASVDDTPKILKEFSETDRVHSVRYPRREPKNYARVPVLLNMAAKIAQESDFYMISGDDCFYPPDYISNLIEFMQRDKVELAAGFCGDEIPAAPHGSGRVISAALFKEITPFPQSIGWESWMLYKTMSMGKKIAVYPIRFEHGRKYSLGSTWTFGHSAYVNGVPFIFTVLRSVKSLVLGTHTPINALSIVLGHLEYMLRKPEKLDCAKFTSNWHKWRIKQFIRSKL